VTNDSSVKKILILAANPKNSVPLRLDEEVREIDEGLTRAQMRDRFELEQKWAVRPRDVQRAILDFAPQIVHFSGHGVGEGGLALEDELGQAKLVSTSALAGLFELFADQVECVLLNACYSVVQAEAIALHIPYVIGMNQAVGDQTAIVFAVAFYDALGAGRDFEFAYKSGCVAIQMAGISEKSTPQLKKRSDRRKIESNSSEVDISIVETNGYFYVVRSRLENRSCEEILKPGMLMRIKSPEKMGKSLMMSRVMEYVRQKGYRTAVIDLREANQETFTDINEFLQWLCAYVSDQLDVDQDPKENWKKYLGANPNCTKFFEKHFLSVTEQPLVIAFDNFDCIFEHSNIEIDFCSLLRGWFEKVNTSKAWGNLRQIIVYSQESYAIKDVNQSPFNVGLSVELGELDAAELLALANAYGLSWTNVEAAKLMNMIGGNSYLAQRAFDQLSHQELNLEDLLRMAPTDEGIYRSYLNERLQSLEMIPLLVEAMRKVVNSDNPVRLGSKEAFKLASMGLIKRQGNDIVPCCRLYHLYFRDKLRDIDDDASR
jgi:AAA-like domain/CHAT domain